MRWKACGANATLERVRCTFTSLSAWVSLPSPLDLHTSRKLGALGATAPPRAPCLSR